MKEMQALFDNTGGTSISSLLECQSVLDAPIEKYTIHDNITLFKRYVSTLPESLFGGEAVYSAWLFVGSALLCIPAILAHGAAIHEEAVRVEKAIAVLTLLPPLYRHALHSVFHLLYLVAQQAAQNKVCNLRNRNTHSVQMTANNLARSFALSILCAATTHFAA